jgi:hypothetical protein
MRIDPVGLRCTAEPSSVRVREMNGYDERAVDDRTTDTAIRLLDGLVRADDSSSIGSVADLTASDRDRLLAAVYRAAFGDRIESTVTCSRCRLPFDLRFSLTDLLDSLDRDSHATGAERFPDNTFRLPGTPRFRLPTGRDERAIACLPAADAERELLRRCVVDGPIADPDALQHALERLAPLMDVELGARCAECGANQVVHFDIQSYLLGALANEHRRLIVDVHRLASAFNWSLGEILSLPRTERRTLVDLVDADRPRRVRA